MFRTYKTVLSYPGALNFSAAGVIARLPMAMINIGIVLLVQGVYGNYQLAGRVSAINIFAYAVAVPFLSRLIDRYGQRQIMVPSFIISTVALIGLAMCAHYHMPVWYLYVLGAISGATEGNFGSLVRARWSKVCEKGSHLQTAFALEATLDEVCFVTGPVLATYLATSVHDTAAMWASAAATVVGGTWFLSQTSTQPKPVKNDNPTMNHSLLRSVAMVSILFVAVGAGTMFGVTDIVVVAFCDELGRKSTAGIVLAGFACGSLLGGLLYGAREWKLGLLRRFIVGVVLLGIGASCFLLTHSIPGLIAVMFVTGFAIAPTLTNITSIVQLIVPPSRLTEGIAWVSTAMNCGIALGANMSGELVDRWGTRSGFWLIAVCAWLMILIAGSTLPLVRNSMRRLRKRKVQAVLDSEL